MLRIAFAIVFFLPVTGHLAGQGRDVAALTKGDIIEDLLFDYYDEHGFNGSVLVAEKGEVVYENTFGFADWAAREPLDGGTPFYLASLAKQFTAAAIVRLAEEGRLSLDNPVRKFLPMMPGVYDQVTLYHLLTHTGGVPDYFAAGIARPGLTNMDVYKMLVEHGRLDFTPGTKFRYSNSGYVLLAIIIRITTGIPAARYYEEEIFGPLEMSDSFVLTDSTAGRWRARGYDGKGRDDDYQLRTIGDGGIYATARDLYKWLAALQEGRFVSREGLDRLFTPVKLVNGRSRNYGLGWEIGSNLSGRLAYHTGGLAGFRTYLECQPATGNAIIILTNNSFARINELRNDLVKILENRYPARH